MRKIEEVTLAVFMLTAATSHAGWLEKLFRKSDESSSSMQSKQQSRERIEAEHLIDAALKTWKGPKDLDSLMRLYGGSRYGHQPSNEDAVLLPMFALNSEML